ncbi:hypothetical protein GTY67_13255 [Streptomyces sp. SID8374]|uniref:helix-turn-helix transcriptional regulator n=1 Tax=Streptomyces sp. SID8374 TaxID=2690354 RepID=UPI00136CEBDF|nr:hypothetical protein [Streptomyces sp. SID8374]MYX14364.1 hypothetical protein [Streptomyces sp. SID8374]
MVATSAPTPPEGRPGVTYAEIAAHYDLAPRYVAENTRWGRHPGWPAAVAKRGRSAEFDAASVHAFVQQHHTRQAPGLDPARLYTATEIATHTGLSPATIYADISRNRWPAPDQELNGARLWYGSTVTDVLARRRSYGR